MVFATTGCDKKKDDDRFSAAVNDEDATGLKTSNILRNASTKKAKKSDLAVYDLTTVGVKNFAQINVTMSRLTGVGKGQALAVFNAVQSSLPSKNNYALFTGSMQVGVVKLAAEYCHRAFNNEGLRNTILGDLQGLYSTKLTEAFTEENQENIHKRFAEAFWVHPTNYAKGADTKRIINELYKELIPGRADNAAESQRLLRATCVLYLSASPVIIL
jgi:hypothetical protein